jgi:hypothetical protein
MTSVIIMGLLAGFFFTGGLPHFIKGVMGKGYPMPMGQATSAAKSVVWGWLNWVVAAMLWHVAPMRFHARAAFVGVAVGALVTGLLMSNMKYKTKGRKEA